MSSMTFVVSKSQQPETLGLYQVFGTKKATFWESLSAESRAKSFNAEICRAFSKQTAWDIAGPVLEHWNNVLVHAVHATFSNHRASILGGRGWDGAIDCWMIGDRTESAVPKIVLSCLDLPTVKRFMKKLVKDTCLRDSGFDLVGRRGWLEYAADSFGDGLRIESYLSSAFQTPLWRDSNVNEASAPQSLYERYGRADSLATETLFRRQPISASIDICGLQTVVQSSGLTLRRETRAATIGGTIIVDEELFFLTVAHPFAAKTGEEVVRESDWRSTLVDRLRGNENTVLSTGGSAEAPLDHCGDPESVTISWDDVNETDDTTLDTLNDYEEQSNSSQHSDESMSHILSNGHSRIESDAFTLSKIGTTPSSALPIASFKIDTDFRHPNARLERDWALLCPRIQPSSIVNQVSFRDRVLQITTLGELDEETNALLVQSSAGRHGGPKPVICSRAASLIPVLDGLALNIAHKVYEQIKPGDSGSWIIDSNSGVLLGIVVATNPKGDYGYMLRSTEVFADLKASRSGRSGEVAFGLPSEELFSKNASLAQRILRGAVHDGNDSIVGMLLNQSVARIDVEGPDGDRLLSIAHMLGHHKIVEFLLASRTTHPPYNMSAAATISQSFALMHKPLNVLSSRKRTSKPKVRSGCKTCKIRRIKCDETAPSCKRCTSTGRKCDGYEFPKLSSPSRMTQAPAVLEYLFEPLVLSPTFFGTATVQERRLFHRFRYCTVPAFCPGSDEGLWTRLLAPSAMQEPLVGSAILALAALHEDYQDRQGDYKSQTLQRESYASALERYGSSLRQLNQRLNEPAKENAKIAIITSIVFAYFELLRRNDKAAIVHYQQGMRELSRQLKLDGGSLSKSTPKPPQGDMRKVTPKSEIDEIMRAFGQLDLQMVAGNKSELEPLEENLPHASETALANRSPSKLHRPLERLLIVLYQAIKSDGQIYRYWDRQKVPSVWQTHMQSAREVLDVWMTNLDGIFPSDTQPSNVVWHPADYKWLLGLWLHLKVASIELRISIDCGPETTLDIYQHDFHDILTIVERCTSEFKLSDGRILEAETTPFTMSFGIGYSVYFTAIRCRNRVIRRRAIQQLRKTGKESYFEGPIMAILAQRLMELEEEGIPLDEVIPESSRFHEVKWKLDYDERQISFEATRALDTTWKNWYVHQEVIKF